MQKKLSDNYSNRQPLVSVRLLAAVCLLLIPFGHAHAKPDAPSIDYTLLDTGGVFLSWSWDRDSTETCRIDGYEIQYKTPSESWPDSNHTNDSDSGKFKISQALGSTGDVSLEFVIDSSARGADSSEDGVALRDTPYQLRVRISDTSATGGCEASDFSAVVAAGSILEPEALIVTPSVLALIEGGADGAFKVKLDQQPSTNVTVAVTSASGPINIKTKSVTFTPSNWNVEQDVIVEPETDADTRAEEVSVYFGANGALEYSFGVEQTASVLVRESRGPRIIVTPDRGLTIPEGHWNYVDIVLSQEPTGQVLLEILIEQPDGKNKIGTSSPVPIQVMFNQADAETIAKQISAPVENFLWSTPRRLTLNAFNDSDSSDETGTIVIRQVDATDIDPGDDIVPYNAPEYLGQVARVPVKVFDVADANAVPTILTSPESTLNLGEGHGAIISVVLSNNYTGLTQLAKVTVSSSSDKVKVNPLLTNATAIDNNSVTMITRDRPVQFFVTALPDDDENDETVTLTFQASGTNSGGNDYTSVVTAAKTVTVNVDDGARPSVSFTPPSDKSGNITATFSQSVSSDASSVVNFTNVFINNNKVQTSTVGTIDKIITLAQGSRTGTAIAFDATISGNVVTIDPTEDLPSGTIYVEISDKYWNYSGVQGSSASDTFTIAEAIGNSLVLLQPESQPLTVSVADTEVAESAGAQLAFQVSLNRAVDTADGTVSVDYATSDGTATAGADYTAASGTLTFSVGESSKTVNVAVLDDAHNEGSETMKLELSNAVGMTIADDEATGTITNEDPLPKAWIARLARTMAEQHIDVVTKRLDASRNPGGRANFANHSLDLSQIGYESDFILGPSMDGYHKPLTIEDDGFDDFQMMSLQDALQNSSFALTGERDASGGSMAVWGQAAHNVFDGREDMITLDGKVSSAILGVDYGNGGWLGGIAISTSSAKGNYDGLTKDDNSAVLGMSGKVKAKLTSLTAYGSMEISERSQVWGAIAHGQGSLTLTPKIKNAKDEKTDLDWNMAAGGLRSTLLESREGSGELNFVSDAMWTSSRSDKIDTLAAARANLTRIRLGLESRWTMQTGGSGMLSPTLEFGLRHDGGDAENGLGVELGGAIVWENSNTGFSVDIASRALIAHEDEDFEERGYSAGITFDPNPESSRGFSMSLRHELGSEAYGGLDSLFADGPLSDRSESDYSARIWKLDAAWGLPALGGSFTATPNAGVNLFEDGRDIHFGWQISPADQDPYNFSMGFKARSRDVIGRSTENFVGFDLRLRW